MTSDTRPRMHLLDRDECLRLLAGDEIGRLAFVSRSGAMVVPVNYALYADTIVSVRTQAPSSMTAHGPGRASRSIASTARGALVGVWWRAAGWRRSRLLSSYAWSTVGRIAGIAAWVAFAGATVMAAWWSPAWSTFAARPPDRPREPAEAGARAPGAIAGSDGPGDRSRPRHLPEQPMARGLPLRSMPSRPQGC